MKVKIFTLAILICAIFSNASNDRLIVLMGPTRAGKSCFINTITNKNVAAVGDDSGQSTTKKTHIFKERVDGFPTRDIYELIDTMGFDDTEESQLGDPMILTETIFTILNSLKSDESINLSSVLLFESLTNDANSLEKNIKKLIAAFGENILKSVIVVLNKNPNPNRKRMETLLKLINKYKVNYIHWQTNCTEERIVTENYYKQMEQLNILITKYTRTINQGELMKIVVKLHEEGKIIFDRNQEASTGKIRNWVLAASTVMTAFSYISFPTMIVAGLATYGFEKFVNDIKENAPLLISLAIDDRMYKMFKR